MPLNSEPILYAAGSAPPWKGEYTQRDVEKISVRQFLVAGGFIISGGICGDILFFELEGVTNCRSTTSVSG